MVSNNVQSSQSQGVCSVLNNLPYPDRSSIIGLLKEKVVKWVGQHPIANISQAIGSFALDVKGAKGYQDLETGRIFLWKKDPLKKGMERCIRQSFYDCKGKYCPKSESNPKPENVWSKRILREGFFYNSTVGVLQFLSDVKHVETKEDENGKLIINKGFSPLGIGLDINQRKDLVNFKGDKGVVTTVGGDITFDPIWLNTWWFSKLRNLKNSPKLNYLAKEWKSFNDTKISETVRYVKNDKIFCKTHHAKEPTCLKELLNLHDKSIANQAEKKEWKLLKKTWNAASLVFSRGFFLFLGAAIPGYYYYFRRKILAEKRSPVALTSVMLSQKKKQ